MIRNDPPFRFQGGDDSDGFPSIADAPRPEITWTIQFELGDGWRDLGLAFKTNEEAEEAIQTIKSSWKSDINLRARSVLCLVLSLVLFIAAAACAPTPTPPAPPPDQTEIITEFIEFHCHRVEECGEQSYADCVASLWNLSAGEQFCSEWIGASC